MPISFFFLMVAVLMVPNAVRRLVEGDWQIALAEVGISGVFGGIAWLLTRREMQQRRPR